MEEVARHAFILLHMGRADHQFQSGLSLPRDMGLIYQGPGSRGGVNALAAFSHLKETSSGVALSMDDAKKNKRYY